MLFAYTQHAAAHRKTHLTIEKETERENVRLRGVPSRIAGIFCVSFCVGLVKTAKSNSLVINLQSGFNCKPSNGSASKVQSLVLAGSKEGEGGTDWHAGRLNQTLPYTYITY